MQVAREHHLLAHLGVQVEEAEQGRTRGRMVVRDDHLGPAGVAPAGQIATFVDLAGGVAAANSSEAPVVTADLSLRLVRAVAAGELRGSARILRSGRRAVITEVLLSDPEGVAVGIGTMTSAKLPVPEGQREREASWRGHADREDRDHRPVWDVDPESAPAGVPLFDHLGVQTVAAGDGDGACRAELRPDLVNGAGMLHGGMGALLVDRAATVACGAEEGEAVHVEDVTLYYLAPGRRGPFVATARRWGTAEGRTAARVDVVDAGAEDRLVVAGLATVSHAR